MPKGIYKRILPVWNKGKKTGLIPKTAFKKGVIPETAWSKGHSPWNKGKHHSEATKTKLKISRQGRIFTEETKLKMSKAHKGEKSYLWKGGITPINQNIRNSIEYKDWRTKVFKRDDYTCQECGSRGVTLQADHIKPFAYYPELRLVIENGRTLCVPCHKKTDTYGYKGIHYKKLKLRKQNE